MNKNISISLFRISGDSKYLDLVFSCPEEFHFTSLQLEVRFVEGNDFKSSFYDLSQALFPVDDSTDSDEDSYQTRFVVRLPIDKLGISTAAIYIGTFKAINNEDYLDELTSTAICSDVNYAYRCMMDDLFMKEKSDTSCEDLIPDEVIRKYLLLYGHTAAMAVEDLDTAQAYFKLIGNCFGNCPSNGRGKGSCCGNNSKCEEGLMYRRPPIHSCNCGR